MPRMVSLTFTSKFDKVDIDRCEIKNINGEIVDVQSMPIEKLLSKLRKGTLTVSYDNVKNNVIPDTEIHHLNRSYIFNRNYY